MTSSRPEILSVNLSVEKGTRKQPQPRIAIDAQGVVGDAHAGPGLRQVSLLAEESIAKFGGVIGRVLAAGEFAENLTTRGLELAEVAVLDRLRVGEVLLEVTQRGKACHGEGCAIFREVGRCVMPQEGIFARVLHGGTIEPGDGIDIDKRVFEVWVVTVSDRASAGEYEDRSGPRAAELLEEYLHGKNRQVACRRAVVPDEPEQLAAALAEARQAQADIVITTGGTGIGPRDITPEVVTAQCGKLIPGIMEQIRTTYGRENPAALLSRSVAGVMGSSLVYALPGSVRAVEQYLAEILKTMEHLIYTLHGLDVHP